MADAGTTDGATLVDEGLAELATAAGQADPYPIYERLRTAGEVGRSSDGTLVVTGYRACAALLKDHRLAKHPERLLTLAGHTDWDARPSLHTMFTSLLMINPPDHTRLRRQVASAFTPRRVAALRPAVERIAAELCDTLVERLVGGQDRAADAVADFAFPFPVTVIGELLGVPEADRARFQSLVRDWTGVLEMLSPMAVEVADEAAAAIREHLGALADERRRRAADDLISALVTAPDPMTDDELVTMLALLFAAGFETTTGLLANGLVALLDRPDEAASLAASPDPTAAVEELLRFDSPVQMLFGRSADTAVDVGVPTVADPTAVLQLVPGQRMVLLLGAANRDPDVFDAPDELRLDRSGPPPLSFGGGIHYCLGAPLARLEAQVALPMLLRRFPGLERRHGAVHRTGLALHGWSALPVGLSVGRGSAATAPAPG